MKRIAVLLVLILACAGLAAAEGIALGSFPLGSWLDANHNAVWVFDTGSIVITSPSGELVYDSGKATGADFKIGAEAGGPPSASAARRRGRPTSSRSPSRAPT